MISFEKACNIILSTYKDYSIVRCDDGGNCFIFGMRKDGDEIERGLRGPFRVYKDSGKVDNTMDVEEFLDYIMEHDNTELDISGYDTIKNTNQRKVRVS